ncbi:hypothetical protein [Massilia sp. BJB1822]|uniref:hypothetical protein n=1 Tax=Massilia sp. BJB1822 TaxID=2744470 RepID=UPI001594D660|nr:hypothetical protein [Massilia sp. BJB1822]NVE01857.1 hypothetical protein [Massilia sp. BJB1822]
MKAQPPLRAPLPGAQEKIAPQPGISATERAANALESGQGQAGTAPDAGAEGAAAGVGDDLRSLSRLVASLTDPLSDSALPVRAAPPLDACRRQQQMPDDAMPSSGVAARMATASQQELDALQPPPAPVQEKEDAVLAAAPRAPAEDGAEVASLAAEQEEAPAGAGAGGEEVGARRLHIYQDEHGVQAWVRDAQLDGWQALALAQAMASELAGSGNRLTALTLNGKTLLREADERPGGMRGGGQDWPSATFQVPHAKGGN